ncbi:MAG: DsrE family protein [Pseudomonadota bacterium]
MTSRCCTLFLLCLASIGVAAKDPMTGPVIADYGPTFAMDVDVPVDAERRYRVVFDAANHRGGTDAVNRSLVTVARYLNMHGRAGVAVDRHEIAVVFHGEALKSALHQEAYRERYATDNPNLELIAALQEAGVSFYACGQSLGFRGFDKEELTNGVAVALSAMTMLVTLQNDGYALIPW